MAPPDRCSSPGSTGSDGLSDLGLDKKTSSLAQLGRMLKDSERNCGGRPPETCTTQEQVISPPTLAELGLTKKESMVAQAVEVIW